jgi:ABC-type glucose/galactose transport system permease subunit
MGIKSTIEASTAVFRPSMKRVADIGGTSIFGGRGRYSGTVIVPLILTVLNSILTLLDAPESVRQIRGPSGAFEDGDFCA